MIKGFGKRGGFTCELNVPDIEEQEDDDLFGTELAGLVRSLRYDSSNELNC